MTVNYEYSRAMGRKLSALRLARGLTQEQLAAQMQVAGCDVTRSAIAKVEVGQRHLYPDEIKAVKNILAVEYDELFI